MIPRHWFRQANVWLVLAALLVAASSYWLAQRYVRQQAQVARTEVTQAWATRDVVVASAELPAGLRLAPASLARRAVPERYLASDALTPATAGGAVGLRLLRPLRAGEVLSSSALEHPGERTLANLVEPGERALTIPVDEPNAAAGLLAPGDYIDLLLVLRDEGDAATTPRVLPLLQAVQVLATGRATRPRAGDAGPEVEASYATITLRLHPDEAQRVLLAQKLGELSVAVRPAGESQPLALAAIGREALFPARPAHAARRAGRPGGVEFIIGGMGASGGVQAVATRARAGARS
jgi:pilus assembly protein CpaB